MNSILAIFVRLKEYVFSFLSFFLGEFSTCTVTSANSLPDKCVDIWVEALFCYDHFL